MLTFLQIVAQTASQSSSGEQETTSHLKDADHVQDKARADEKAQHTWGGGYVSILKRLTTTQLSERCIVKDGLQQHLLWDDLRNSLFMSTYY